MVFTDIVHRFRMLLNRAKTVRLIYIKFGRQVLCHYMVSDADFKMDSLNRAGARNVSS